MNGLRNMNILAEGGTLPPVSVGTSMGMPTWHDMVQNVANRAPKNHAGSMESWTLLQRVWMTMGYVLSVGGRLFDSRFPRS